ncbi:MAG: hypothetical protein IJR14_08005 [Synergistaceae bacterium]|nr:hypothetical protein [Synergistaceae bacterium]
MEEIRAMTGTGPAVPVALSIAEARPGWAVELGGRPVAIFGAGPAGDGITGRPWLVGTDEIERHPVTFYRMSRPLVEEMRRRYERLENWTDARNMLSLRWLGWLGFHIEPPEPMGAEGRPFHRFWMERGDEDVHDAGDGDRRGGDADARLVAVSGGQGASARGERERGDRGRGGA